MNLQRLLGGPVWPFVGEPATPEPLPPAPVDLLSYAREVLNARGADNLVPSVGIASLREQLLFEYSAAPLPVALDLVWGELSYTPGMTEPRLEHAIAKLSLAVATYYEYVISPHGLRRNIGVADLLQGEVPADAFALAADVKVAWLEARLLLSLDQLALPALVPGELAAVAEHRPSVTRDLVGVGEHDYLGVCDTATNGVLDLIEALRTRARPATRSEFLRFATDAGDLIAGEELFQPGTPVYEPHAAPRVEGCWVVVADFDISEGVIAPVTLLTPASVRVGGATAGVTVIDPTGRVTDTSPAQFYADVTAAEVQRLREVGNTLENAHRVLRDGDLARRNAPGHLVRRPPSPSRRALTGESSLGRSTAEPPPTPLGNAMRLASLDRRFILGPP